ncbi:MAG: SIS domain-containing protein [Eubacteriales bacterium]|nr:SIS domain-containing protein [Eubacteriales bacterium]
MDDRMITELAARIPALAPLRDELTRACAVLVACYAAGGKVLTCGNGGSAADSEHIVGELMKGFLCRRPLSPEQRARLAAVPGLPEGFADGLQQGLAAISLVSQAGLISAFSNDVDPSMVYAQQVFAYGKPGDVLIALSTSGNSKNVVNAAFAARAAQLHIIGLTGADGGRLNALCDVCLRAPAQETYQVQEYHLALYHALCACTEAAFFQE